LGDPKKPPWYQEIYSWLEKRPCPPEQPWDPKDIVTLATDPPIPFFARFEAGLDPDIQGKRLGVLTSIVVADVFYGIFRDDRLLGVKGDLDLASQLQQVSQLMFDGTPDAFASLGRITTVESLIAFLGPLIQPSAGG